MNDQPLSPCRTMTKSAGLAPSCIIRAIIEPVWCVKRPKRSTSTSCRCPATFMPVEALWRWLREDVTYHYCHPTAEDLSRRVAAFETRLNQGRGQKPRQSFICNRYRCSGRVADWLGSLGYSSFLKDS